MKPTPQGPVNERERARAIEPAAFHSWPACETRNVFGWISRFTNGYTHRGNSVATNGFTGTDPLAAIGAVERLYAERNLPAMFQITPATEPPDLAATLRARGYHTVSPTLLLTAPVDRFSHVAISGEDVVRSSRCPDGFADIVLEGSRSREDGAERLEIVSRLQIPRLFVTAEEGGRAVACGLGIRSGIHVGINMMRTLGPHRRKGHAARILKALGRWAREEGADELYLQVEEANEAALALYRKSGFARAYSYTYLRCGS